MNQEENGIPKIGCVNHDCDKCQQAQKQEPVASIFISGTGEREFNDWWHALPVGCNLLYTTPPQLQPLKDEQARAIVGNVSNIGDGLRIVRAIEADHGIKEKNTK